VHFSLKITTVYHDLSFIHSFVTEHRLQYKRKTSGASEASSKKLSQLTRNTWSPTGYYL